MDGRRVFRRGGPSILGWRRKSPNYELRATDDGVEVRRDGNYSWGIKVDK